MVESGSSLKSDEGELKLDNALLFSLIHFGMLCRFKGLIRPKMIILSLITHKTFVHLWSAGSVIVF